MYDFKNGVKKVCSKLSCRKSWAFGSNKFTKLKTVVKKKFKKNNTAK